MPPTGALVRLTPCPYPDLLDSADLDGLAPAVEESLNYMSNLPPGTEFHFGQDVYTAAELAESMSSLHDFLLKRPSPAEMRQYVKANFKAYDAREKGSEWNVLCTGYYTPELMVSADQDEVFRYPVYALPDDIITADLKLFRKMYAGERVVGMVSGKSFVPYYSRKEIDELGALSGRGLEIAWCASAPDVFFMQVQGSGILVFPDGTKVHANYAGANGREYRSIGRLLIEQGKAGWKDMSLAFLKDYMRAHPEEARAIMDYNESYVFFSVDDKGPYGALGVPVTPGRSIATDGRFFPPGVLAYLETKTPVFTGHLGLAGWETFSRFMLNQDKGGAIKGPGRVDIYFGSGEPAQVKAGYMNWPGSLYFLAPVRASR